MMALRSRLKTMLLGRPGPRPRAVRHGLMKGHRFTIDTSNKSQRLLGLDEREIMPWVRRLAGDVTIAADIGAHDGWYSLYFALQDNIRLVYSFEPREELTAKLQANVRLNGEELLEKFTIAHRFVGNSDEDGWCRLDDVIPSGDDPLLLKIDVDGGEVDVLRGAEKLLATDRVRLIIETHTPELEGQCVALLQEAGYETRIVHNAWYRAIVPESRPSHNRWLIATRPYGVHA